MLGLEERKRDRWTLNPMTYVHIEDHVKVDTDPERRWS